MKCRLNHKSHNGTDEIVVLSSGEVSEDFYVAAQLASTLNEAGIGTFNSVMCGLGLNSLPYTDYKKRSLLIGNPVDGVVLAPPPQPVLSSELIQAAREARQNAKLIVIVNSATTRGLVARRHAIGIEDEIFAEWKHALELATNGTTKIVIAGDVKGNNVSLPEAVNKVWNGIEAIAVANITRTSYNGVEIAAEFLNNKTAQLKMARDYAKSRDVNSRALQYKWYKMAADLNSSVEGQYECAESLRTGEGTEKNELEALRYFQLAAAQGDFRSRFVLAKWYARGHAGLAKDLEEAKKLFSEVSEANVAPITIPNISYGLRARNTVPSISEIAKNWLKQLERAPSAPICFASVEDHQLLHDVMILYSDESDTLVASRLQQCLNKTVFASVYMDKTCGLGLSAEEIKDTSSTDISICEGTTLAAAKPQRSSHQRQAASASQVEPEPTIPPPSKSIPIHPDDLEVLKKATVFILVITPYALSLMNRRLTVGEPDHLLESWKLAFQRKKENPDQVRIVLVRRKVGQELETNGSHLAMQNPVIRSLVEELEENSSFGGLDAFAPLPTTGDYNATKIHEFIASEFL
ncbi:hypothetical protein HDU99_001188, partial [Rhizoclosmatium hyalinum]